MCLGRTCTENFVFTHSIVRNNIRESVCTHIHIQMQTHAYVSTYTLKQMQAPHTHTHTYTHIRADTNIPFCGLLHALPNVLQTLIHNSSPSVVVDVAVMALIISLLLLLADAPSVLTKGSTNSLKNKDYADHMPSH